MDNRDLFEAKAALRVSGVSILRHTQKQGRVLNTLILTLLNLHIDSHT